jgi:hypothetical protein
MSPRRTTVRRRRNKTSGGAGCKFANAPIPASANAALAPAIAGGRRKTRKMHKGASDWNKLVMKVYKEMKAKDNNVKLGAAMKRAAEMKRKGMA